MLQVAAQPVLHLYETKVLQVVAATVVIPAKARVARRESFIDWKGMSVDCNGIWDFLKW